MEPIDHWPPDALEAFWQITHGPALPPGVSELRQTHLDFHAWLWVTGRYAGDGGPPAPQMAVMVGRERMS